MFVADIYEEGLPGVLDGKEEHGGFCSGNTGTKQENHREHEIYSEQGNKAYFRERIRILS